MGIELIGRGMVPRHPQQQARDFACLLDMMPPALRQRLLNEGRPGALAFVATQTDVLVSLPHFEYLERQPLPTAIKGEVLGHHLALTLVSPANSPSLSKAGNISTVYVVSFLGVARAVRSEIIENLSLPRKSSIERCALE
eukprot:1157727-Pelagomonas_calceolata.AAC.17